MSPGYVLIVDDDDTIRELASLLLELDGFEARGAACGLQALEVIEAWGLPGLILLDLRMPLLNGEEFLARARRLPLLREVPVVLLSGDPRVEEVGARLGCRAVKKPFDPEELLELVRAILRPAPPTAPARP